MSATPTLFRFAQFEFPWTLGPPDGRYLLRAPGAASASPPTQVLVVRTLGAPERRRLSRRARQASPEPDPVPVTTTRATVIDVSDPLADGEGARRWLTSAGEEELAVGLGVLNRALHAYRLASADPYVNSVRREQALVSRLGWGRGEQVADGLWVQAHEFEPPQTRRRRIKALEPQARLAAVMNGRAATLACEELALRARLDLDQGRTREAALQLLVALDAALAELPADRAAAALADRLIELSAQRPGVVAAAQAALSGPLTAAQLDIVTFTLGRIEAALRARAAAEA
ncbi:MAG: hypothetical protein JO153_06485 [Solirubrobacterales bacterium]|nr:hypothetical protein [Solirubrobacterales bacterium]